MKTNAKKINLREIEHLLFHETDSSAERDKDSLKRKKLYKNGEADRSKTAAVINMFRGTLIDDYSEPCFLYDIAKTG